MEDASTLPPPPVPVKKPRKNSEVVMDGIRETAASIGMDPLVLATIISYETGGTFNPVKAGPTTQWGQHRGLIQFGEPQAREMGVDWDNPIGSQLGPDKAVAKYFKARGWKPGMSMNDAYSIVNAGSPGRGGATDANNGGAPGTVDQKVAGMGAHRAKAAAFLGMDPADLPDFDTSFGGGGSSASGGPLDNYTGADLGPVSETPALSYITQREQDAAQEEYDASAPGMWEGITRAFDEQSATTALVRMYNQPDFAPDNNFQYGEELWKEVSTGLPEEYLEALGEATSEAHARSIATETRRSYEQDAQLGKMGWTGVGLQFGAAILDPVAIVATAATEGALGPVIYGAKLGKLSRFLRAGVAGAAVNTGIDSVLIAADPVAKWEGLAYSAAAGFLLGGTVGAFRRTEMDQEMARPLKGFMAQVDAKEAGVTPPATAAAPQGGSLSAALAPVEKQGAAEELLEQLADEPLSAFGAARIDMIGRLKQSDNPILRRVASLLDEDALGNADGTTSIISANERAVRQIKQTETRFYKTYNTAFAEWSKTKGLRMKRHVDPAVRAQFNAEVGLAVRRPLDASKDGSVQKVASQIKAEFAELQKFGREHNIRGFADFSASDTYLSRSHNIQAIDDMIAREEARIGVSGRGKKSVERLVAKSLMSGDKKWRAMNPGKTSGLEELTFADAEDVAAAYLKSIRSRKYGQLDLNQAMAGVDDDVLRRMLDDAGLPADRVQKIIDGMTAAVDSGEKGRSGMAKRRLNLDETFFDPATGMKIEDMLENDAELLFNQYANSVIRSGYLEDAFGSLKVPDKEGNLPAHAPSFETLKRYISETNTSAAETGKAELDLLETLYNAVKGLPQEPAAAWKNGLQRLRSYNFTRVMGQLGVAQLSELGTILGNGGVRSFFRHMPMMRKMNYLARNGQMSDALMDEIESIWSMGTDVLRHSPSIRMDDGGGVSFMGRNETSTGWQKADFGLNQGKRAVATLSGMSTINRMLQRFNGRVLVQRFLDHAEGGRQINARRFAALGINPQMADAISDQIKKHMGSVKGFTGKKVTHINIEQWDDIDAKNAFINGVDRWARRSIQENNPGSMPAFMTKELGKTVFQFRSFMLGAYTKQLLAGAQMRDWETFSSFAGSMFFGGLFYMGQTQINSVGRADREEWVSERLSAANIAKASFQRAGFSSVLPMAIDTGLMPFTDEPVFAFRTSELSTGVLGNPTFALMDAGGRALGGAISAATRSDYDFSQQNFRDMSSLVFMQNAFGIRNIMAAIGGELPRFSQ